jgi:hypothetical protein
LNQHIDEVIIPDGQDLSGGLVGQINQNEKSAQWLFPHNYGGPVARISLLLFSIQLAKDIY